MTNRWSTGTAAALALLVGAASPTCAGGGGPLDLTRLKGRVEIMDLGAPELGWKPARKGSLEGRYLLRTGNGAWAHLDRRTGCLDGNSVVLIDSAADYEVRVLKGKVTAVDGRDGPPIFKVYRTLGPIER